VAQVTLDSYVETVCGLLDGLPSPVILVGHSRGGIVISQSAERCPDKVAKLVYLAAFLIPNGQPMLPTALSDKDSLITANLEVDEKEGWHMLKSSAYKEALYHDCTDEDVELASSLLTKEPNAPVATPLRLTRENFGRVDRVYIETLDDRGVTNALQKKMYAALPCSKVFSITSSHSPFLSAPRELASDLTVAAGV
jgi:pimeloyl-ACP methyl ester carboxylesterase